MLTLLEPVDVRAVLRNYLERGDLHLADALVSSLEQDLVPAVPEASRPFLATGGSCATPSGRAGAPFTARRTPQQARSWPNCAPSSSTCRRSENSSVASKSCAERAPEGAFGRACVGIGVLEGEMRVMVQQYVERLREAVAQATVVEVRGPFLDLAERLAVEWDGLPDGLPSQLLRLTAGPAPDRVPVPRPSEDGADHSPAPSERRPAPRMEPGHARQVGRAAVPPSRRRERSRAQRAHPYPAGAESRSAAPAGRGP